MTKVNWSEYQKAIFSTVEGILESKRDLVIFARAGTGKTTTMVEATIRLCRRNRRARVLTCAFNVKNARDLDSKLRAAGIDWKQAAAKTLNSVGFATVKKAWGKGVEVDGKKGKTIAKKVLREYLEKNPLAETSLSAGSVAKLATLAKVKLVDPSNSDAMEEIVQTQRVCDCDETALCVRLAREAMNRAKADRTVVDFDDQLWFPHVFRLQPWKHDLVIVDEAQDMNASQLALARKSVKRGGRLIAIGDPRQAIYGWRGADSEFLSRMTRDLGAKTLPLPRTYRCGKAIVAAARKIVPDYEAAAGNVEGEVVSMKYDAAIDALRPGDFLISRTNAPLLPACIELLKRKVPAVIQGRDIMGQLIGIVERSKCESTADFLEYLDEYVEAEVAKLVLADADEEVIAQLRDREACLRTLAPERATCRELVAFLSDLFSDYDDEAVVTLSSAHRSKGLERDRVFLLADTFRTGGQEDNCRYVAMTRAKTLLAEVVGGVR